MGDFKEKTMPTNHAIAIGVTLAGMSLIYYGFRFQWRLKLVLFVLGAIVVAYGCAMRLNLLIAPR